MKTLERRNLPEIIRASERRNVLKHLIYCHYSFLRLLGLISIESRQW